jgi:hypothetical protein
MSSLTPAEILSVLYRESTRSFSHSVSTISAM